jgi:hypothetical protein
MACARVRIELVDDATNARHTRDRPDQSLNFRLKDGPVQPHHTIGRDHRDRVRMRNDASKLGPHPLNQHFVVNRPSSDDAAGTRDKTCRAVCDVHAGGTECVRTHARCMGELVADQCATPAAAPGIEKVHEPNAEAQTRQQCTVISEHHSPPHFQSDGV